MEAPEHLAADICCALDEPLAAHGFAAGQGGFAADRGQLVFCASEDEFREQHPGVLPTAGAPGQSGCVDIVVDLELSPVARIGEVRLEAEPLPALLAKQGHAAAADEAGSIGNLPTEQALACLPGLLRLALANERSQ